MPSLVTERRRESYSKKIGSDGEETISIPRTFDVSGVSTYAEAIAAIGISKNDPHPQDPSATVVSFGSERIISGANGFFTVTIEYSTDGGGDAQLLSPPIIQYEPYLYIEQSDRDVNKVPYVNTAGMPFDQPLEIEKVGIMLSVTRWESSYDVQKALQFSGKVNSGNFSWPGGYVVDGRAKCLGIYQGDRSSNSNHTQVSYKFDLREEGHQKNVIDQGAVGWCFHDGEKVSGLFVGGDPATATTDGVPIGNIRLDGTGQPIIYNVLVSVPRKPPKLSATPPQPSPSNPLKNDELSTDEITVLTFKRSKSISFAGLSL